MAQGRDLCPTETLEKARISGEDKPLPYNITFCGDTPPPQTHPVGSGPVPDRDP